jgi:predicted MFS family arabinose efflux permease
MASPARAIRTRWNRSLLATSPALVSLTGGLLISETADQFGLIAIIWIAITSTGSPAAAGLVVLLSRLPAIVSAPLFGPRFDRLRPEMLTAAGYLVRAGCVITMAALSLSGALNIGAILALCLVMGIVNPLAEVGTRVILPRIVPGQNLESANGVISTAEGFPYLVGPALGGAFVAFGGAPALLLPGAMCLLSAVLTIRLHVPSLAAPAGAPAPARRRGDLLGFGPLFRQPTVRAMVILTIVYFLSYGPLEPAIPVYTRHQLGHGAAAYGAMWSALGAGALVGLVMIPALSRLRPAVVNAAGAVAWGIVLLPLLFVTSLPAALAIMFVGGFVWAPYIATEVSVIQRCVAPEQHGAAFGARRALIVASSPTGAAMGGVLLEHYSSVKVIGISATACILAGGICLALPSVRRARLQPSEPAPRPEVTTQPGQRVMVE